MAIMWLLLTVSACVHICSGAVVNLALRKQVGVSSRLNGRNPALAVDGNTGTVDPNIIHTAVGQSSAYWWVDLGKQVTDPTVKIYFRTLYTYRRNGLQLRTSTRGFSYPDGNLCSTVTGRADGADIPDIYSVECSGTWRYLLIYTDTDNDRAGPILDFGEVQVLGCDETYGQNCDKSCSSRQCAVTPTSCDRYNGACPVGGCKAGYTGRDCTQACSGGQYGVNCSKYCISRECVVSSETCDHVTGECPGGCTAGWQGTDCTEECSQYRYGVNCGKSCSFRRCAVTPTSCDRYTGVCPSGGCEPGYRDIDCAAVCESDTYGPNCSLSCSNRKCKNLVSSSCHHVTGQCVYGCQPGWNGTDCTRKCQPGTYGDRCEKLCRNRFCMTASDTCDHIDGACPSDGCRPGRMGIDCTQLCPYGKYGANCEKSCSARRCKTFSPDCDRENGTCPNGCQEGWRGVDCTSQCPDGTFGSTCLSCTVRHCQGDSNCPADGTCSGGCQDGWTLNNCTQACPSGTYGSDCSSTCGNCSDGTICNHVTGHCPGDCNAGWRGSQCKRNCLSETYGVNCEKKCGHCNGTCSTITGYCPGGCQQGYNGTRCEIFLEAVGPVSPGFSVAGVVAGIIVAFLVIGIVIAAIIVYRRRRGRDYKHAGSQSLEALDNPDRNSKDKDGNLYMNVSMVPEEKTKQNQPKTRDKPKLTVQIQKAQPDAEPEEELPEEDEVLTNRDYYNVDESEDVIREIPVDKLEDIVQKIKSRKGGFEAEYCRLPTGFTASYDDSQKPENAGKNKFRGYYPYDHNRVRLHLLPDIPGSDYINASIMHSYNKKRTYIAAQAPNKKTVGDFWRMIWEHRCNRIIMLTGLVEATKVKCYQYWPDDDKLDTDQFRIKVEMTDKRANYTIRRLKVTSKESEKSRSVVQYHYTTWPDHGVPDTLALVNFIWMIRRTDTQTGEPLLVHCSAGIGRTGTYIAVDSLLDQARGDGIVDVPGYVSEMRGQRKNMIQTKEQYECVFQCLVEMTKFGNTNMDVENFTTSYSSRGMDSVVDRKTLRELTQMVASEKHNGSPDKHRMWVDGNQDVIIRIGPTLRHLKGYIQVETPPPGLEKLLWKLVEENDVHNVIVMSPIQVELCGDKGVSKKYGDVTVSTTDKTILSPDLTMMTLQLRVTNGGNTANLYTFAGSGSIDNMPSRLLNHSDLHHLSVAATPVVIIHSGSDRKLAGWFCMMSNILCGILEDRCVDVISHVRTFLWCCPELIVTEQDVERFHDFAQRCIEMTDSSSTYANV